MMLLTPIYMYAVYYKPIECIELCQLEKHLEVEKRLLVQRIYAHN